MAHARPGERPRPKQPGRRRQPPGGGSAVCAKPPTRTVGAGAGRRARARECQQHSAGTGRPATHLQSNPATRAERRGGARQWRTGLGRGELDWPCRHRLGPPHLGPHVRPYAKVFFAAYTSSSGRRSNSPVRSAWRPAEPSGDAPGFVGPRRRPSGSRGAERCRPVSCRPALLAPAASGNARQAALAPSRSRCGSGA
jgi:hypothetical protein